MLVPLGAPAGAVPMLTVHRVARAELLKGVLLEVVILHSCASRISMLVHILGEVEILGGIESEIGIAVLVHGVGVHLGVVEAGSGGRLMVVSGVVAGVGEMPGLGSEPAASSLTSDIMLGDQRCVKSSCRENILCLIQNCISEYCP